MAVFSNSVHVDATGRDIARHGTAAFPVASYHDDLSKYDIAWHWHEEMEAVVLTQGSVVFAAGNRKYTLQAGECVDAVSRCVLEITAEGRITPMYIPITLLG